MPDTQDYTAAAAHSKSKQSGVQSKLAKNRISGLKITNF